MPEILAFMDDLMFLSRIQAAARGRGLEVRAVRLPSELVEASRTHPRLILIDLDGSRLPWTEALARLRAVPATSTVPVLGFLGHVHAERARQAREAGCTRVLARSSFVRELPDLLAAAAAGRPVAVADASSAEHPAPGENTP